MKTNPTLQQALEASRSPGDLWDHLCEGLGADRSGDYHHFEDITEADPAIRERIWTGLKVYRGLNQVACPAPLNVSICVSGPVWKALIAVLPPLEEHLTAGAEAFLRLDVSEAAVADAVALTALAGDELELVAAANLLRTGSEPATAAEQQLVKVHQGLSLSALSAPAKGPPAKGLSLSGAGEVPDLNFPHPLIAMGVVAAARMGEDRIGALLGWRRGLHTLGLPGIARLAPIAHIGRDDLERAVFRMEKDERDATYLLLELLKGLRRARESHAALAGERGAGSADGVEEGLNERQAAVMERVRRTPGYATAVAYHKAAFAVVYETARTDLQDLARRGCLRMTRRGRTFLFTEGDGRPEPLLPPPSPVNEPEDSLPVFY